MDKKGILLVNLGTPDSPSTSDVRKYLKEFLMDERVIDIHPALRTLLVKGVIVPFRSPKSAKLYQMIWDDKFGSPLMFYSKLQQKLLQQRLGPDYQVELAMRYQNPSIGEALNTLRSSGVSSIRVIALFPQYASASSGSVHQKVMTILSKWPVIPEVSFVNHFYDNELMIEGFADNGLVFEPQSYDHILFSFHGVPQRHLIKSGCTLNHGNGEDHCGENLTEKNKFCYAAQCYRTAQLIAHRLGLPKSRYSVSFQSRLGNDPWIQPYTSQTITDLAQAGKKRVLVFCPAFVSDCLETIYEIQIEGQETFSKAGGELLQLVPSLNDSPIWIEALADMASQGRHKPEYWNEVLS
jgi:ferrochelatase